MKRLRLALAVVAIVALAVGLPTVALAARPAGEHGGAERQGAEGEHGAKPGLLDFDPGAAVWSIVVFMGLAFVLGRFAWRPILKGLQERERHIRESIERAEKSQADAQKLLDKHKAEMAKAREEAQAVIDEGKASAEKIKAEIVKVAQSEAAAAKKRAEADIAAAKNEALQEIWDTTAVIATEAAGKIIARTLNPDDHRDLVQQAMAQLEGRELS